MRSIVLFICVSVSQVVAHGDEQWRSAGINESSCGIQSNRGCQKRSLGHLGILGLLSIFTGNKALYGLFRLFGFFGFFGLMK